MDEQHRRAEDDRHNAEIRKRLRKRLADAEFARAEREEHKRFNEHSWRLTVFFYGGLFLGVLTIILVALTE